MNNSEQIRYEFGPFVLDPREQRLTRDGKHLALPPKDFEILLALVRRAGSLVEKEELVHEVWPDDAFVEEANVSRRVYAVRRALGDAENGEGYIETVPKRGYRFAVSVRQFTDGASPAVVETVKQTRIIAREEITIDDEKDSLIDSEPKLLPPSIRRWNRTTTLLLAAIAAAVIVTVGLLLIRYYRAAKPLTERDVILLADFENRTGDPVFDGTLKQALAVQLEQSPFLSVFSDERVRETLRYMGRRQDERVTREFAREICERQGLKAFLTGSLVTVGTRYVLLLEAVESRTGNVIAREQQEATAKERVLPGLGIAANRLREKLGESLLSIQQYSAPAEQATTASLEAFKAFNMGEEQRLKGKYPEAIVLCEHAVELDPDFALAYAKLAQLYNDTREPGRAVSNAQRAFALRDRVTEREKLYISVSYYSNVTGEEQKQVDTLELLTRIYPREEQAWNSLSGIYLSRDEFEKALNAANQAFQLNSRSAAARSNLGSALMSLNRFDESEQLLLQAVGEKTDSAGTHLKLFQIAFIKHDEAGMKRELEWAARETKDHAELAWQSSVADFTGQRRAARQLSEQRVIYMKEARQDETAAESALTIISKDALLGSCSDMTDRTNKALELVRNKNTLSLAGLSLALCGESGRATQLIRELAAMYPTRTEIIEVTLPTMRASTDMNGPNAGKAAEMMKSVIPFELSHNLWPIYIRGLVQLRAGDAAGAQDAFQKILAHPGVSPLSIRYALAYLGLARAYALAGDTARSRKAYEEFFRLWKDADQDIPILIDAKREFSRMSK